MCVPVMYTLVCEFVSGHIMTGKTAIVIEYDELTLSHCA